MVVTPFNGAVGCLVVGSSNSDELRVTKLGAGQLKGALNHEFCRNYLNLTLSTRPKMLALKLAKSGLDRQFKQAPVALTLRVVITFLIPIEDVLVISRR